MPRQRKETKKLTLVFVFKKEVQAISERFRQIDQHEAKKQQQNQLYYQRHRKQILKQKRSSQS
jgi:hypothetical protein